MEKLIREVKHAGRSLVRSKGFAAAVMVTLSVCIAVNVAIFAIVNSVLLRPLPVPNANAIVLMSNRYPGAGVGDLNESSSGDYYDRLQEVTVLQEQAMFRFADQTISINGTPERTMSMVATPSLFRLLQVGPLLGRGFTEDEAEVGGEQKVLLSYGMWQQLYGGDRTVLGRELQLSGRSFTIVGVMPPDFSFVDPEVRVWIPLAFTAGEKAVHHSNNWYNIGRLKPGATIQQVQAQIDALNVANLEKLPQMKQILINAGFYTAVEPLQDMLVKDVKATLYLLWAGAVFVLLIGALNVANLALARLSLRRRELATRMALGAGRAQLIRQVLVENLLLATASGVSGVFIGAFLLRILAVVGLNHFPRAYEVKIDDRVVVVAMVTAVAAGTLVSFLSVIGLYKKGFNDILQESERTATSGKGTRRLRQGLVVAQIAFAFFLLIGSGLLLASFRQLLRVDPGFRTNGVVTASISAPEAKYRDPLQLQMLMNRSLEAIRRTPGVMSAGATTTIPLGGHYEDNVILAEGYAMKPGESVISPRRLSVTPGYLETMGVSLLQGRYFQQSDDRSSQLVVIVDERLARRFWPNSDPVGQRMYEPDPTALAKIVPRTVWYRVVGVVRSVRLEDLSGKGNPEGAYYFPYSQDTSNSYTIAVGVAGDSAATVRTIRAEIAAIDPELALFDIRTMSERTQLSLSSRRTSMSLALAFGLFALFLAAVGIYGVLAYLVAHRRREIGIRVALGSTRAGIVRLVLREGFVLVGVGLILGVAGAVSLRTVVTTEIYGVSPLDPLVIGSVAIVFGVVSLAACILPARRAMQVDPAIVLSEQ
jgi:predicted permease